MPLKWTMWDRIRVRASNGYMVARYEVFEVWQPQSEALDLNLSGKECRTSRVRGLAVSYIYVSVT